MGISGIPAIPMIITCLLQGILCDTGIPVLFMGEKCAVWLSLKINEFKKVEVKHISMAPQSSVLVGGHPQIGYDRRG